MQEAHQLSQLVQNLGGIGGGGVVTQPIWLSHRLYFLENVKYAIKGLFMIPREKCNYADFLAKILIPRIV
jgi:hypothetical protein